MTVIRRQHTQRYAVIEEEALNAGDVSLAALGLYAWLIARPDGEPWMGEACARFRFTRPDLALLLSELHSAGLIKADAP